MVTRTRICPLHLTHPSAHSQQWTHTRSSGQPFCGARGAVGGSVPCSRVSPQSWYWRWREHLLFTPPTDNPCLTWESNLQPLGYKSNSLTIRPRLPNVMLYPQHCIQICIYFFCVLLTFPRQLLKWISKKLSVIHNSNQLDKMASQYQHKYRSKITFVYNKHSRVCGCCRCLLLLQWTSKTYNFKGFYKVSFIISRFICQNLNAGYLSEKSSFKAKSTHEHLWMC